MDSVTPDQRVQIVDVRLLVVRSTSQWRGIGGSQETALWTASHVSLFMDRDQDNLHCYGRVGLNVDDLFQGLVPKKLIVGLVSSAAYTENYGKNPFYF